MFTKVLIANRGAIATRIIRTLNTLNIASVAVYAECDADSLHVRRADEAFSLGEGAAADTYLNMDKLLDIAKQTGAEAIHPGYGFLSENAGFVERCTQAGVTFIGPTPEQMQVFGLKHKARELAQKASVPLLPGTELLSSLDSALSAANTIGYPVMLKTTAGGGGIGMQLCHSDDDLNAAFESVKRMGANNFSDDGVFLEKFIARARHIEVQMFGDGQGTAVALGERDCSSQRRNQKVVEECPAPNLTDEVRQQLFSTAESLLSSVAYANAGTVEFIYDADSSQFYFLEVNTRLQVEHGVTEEVYGVDLVEWMLRQASGDLTDLRAQADALTPSGHAIQVRLYAEDPYRNFQPCAGLLSDVSFPQGDGVRIDHWIESGIEVPPYFDPMLAKVIVHADATPEASHSSREQALAKLHQTLCDTRLYGSETNLDYLTSLTLDDTLLKGEVTTRYLNDYVYSPERIDVLQGGTLTTLQDAKGRGGYWHVGVPPSGAFDSHSFRLANRLLGNDDNAAGLEITLQGPTLRFSTETQLVLGGADIDATIHTAIATDTTGSDATGSDATGSDTIRDSHPVPMWQVVTVKAGQTLTLGRVRNTGARTCLCIRGGMDCPDYLGSKATFTLGQFGGHNGRALRTGDVLRLPAQSELTTPLADTGTRLPEHLQPGIQNQWAIRVVYGPHGAPDFFTPDDIQTFFEHDWEIHYNSSRTGIRLIGPKPDWARSDGGEAGLHPSNIHDNAYAFGAVDFTGDMPVILGPDGPSLGGFVCPATVIQADLWKLGQLRAGDTVRFVSVSLDDAVAAEAAQNRQIETLTAVSHTCTPVAPDTPILATFPASQYGVDITCRAAGDHFLLIEYGEQMLDIRLRFRAHALMQSLQQQLASDGNLNGIRELTPGIRSLQIHYDSQRISVQQLLSLLETTEQALASQLDSLTVPSRIVNIPLSWDDEACQQAIEKYDQSVRKNAPWCPSNLEFIRRINGLDSIDDVKQVLFNASYLVMGLGDVYLGAPVATPVDPRHRLVTTKYNPARTWTAENSVGIGGSYLCVYGMEGPGGYQFVGRTLQMWNRYRQTAEFEQPWLLRFFDQIRFYEVSHDELQQIRRDFPQGRYPLTIEESQFSLTEYEAFLEQNQSSIQTFTDQRNGAFAAELERWHADGQFNYTAIEAEVSNTDVSWPEDSVVMDSPVSGSLWQLEVNEGDAVEAGKTLLILESMKMEVPVQATEAGTVTHVLSQAGQGVSAGQALVVIEPSRLTDNAR